MTFAERAAIANPAAGLMVWCTNCGTGGELSIYDGNTWFSASFINPSIQGMIPQSPSDLNVQMDYTTLDATLTWNDLSNNELGFKIERKTGNQSFVEIARVGSNNTSFVDTTLIPNAIDTVFTYRICSFNNLGNSSQYSNEVQVASSCQLNAQSILGNYVITSITYQGIDVFNSVDACSRDNIYSFLANGSFITSDGIVACNPSDAATGTWILNGNTLSLNGSESYMVSDYNCNSMKLTSINTTDIIVITFVRN
jgi:hypothetical protein